jgi:L-iditol 2-dehydrogenase
VHRLPDSIPFDVGAVIEPLACAVHAVVDQARVSGGETIVVFGPGPTGLLIAAVCSTLGAQVLLLGTSHSRPRLELAERFGVARTLSVEADHFSDWISQVLGLGADVVFECSGKLSALETALGLVRPGGRVVVLGEIREPLVLHTQVTLLRKELTLTASKSSVPRSWDRALELLPPLSEMMGAMITHRFPLRRWREAFETVERGDGIKVILTPAGV